MKLEYTLDCDTCEITGTLYCDTEVNRYQDRPTGSTMVDALRITEASSVFRSFSIGRKHFSQTELHAMGVDQDQIEAAEDYAREKAIEEGQ